LGGFVGKKIKSHQLLNGTQKKEDLKMKSLELGLYLNYSSDHYKSAETQGALRKIRAIIYCICGIADLT
jgi:hypothetical protein